MGDGMALVVALIGLLSALLGVAAALMGRRKEVIIRREQLAAGMPAPRRGWGLWQWLGCAVVTGGLLLILLAFSGWVTVSNMKARMVKVTTEMTSSREVIVTVQQGGQPATSARVYLVTNIGHFAGSGSSEISGTPDAQGIFKAQWQPNGPNDWGGGRITTRVKAPDWHDTFDEIDFYAPSARK